MTCPRFVMLSLHGPRPNSRVTSRQIGLLTARLLVFDDRQSINFHSPSKRPPAVPPSDREAVRNGQVRDHLRRRSTFSSLHIHVKS